MNRARTVSIILAFLMFFSFLPANGWAAEGDPVKVEFNEDVNANSPVTIPDSISKDSPISVSTSVYGNGGGSIPVTISLPAPSESTELGINTLWDCNQSNESVWGTVYKIPTGELTAVIEDNIGNTITTINNDKINRGIWGEWPGICFNLGTFRFSKPGRYTLKVKDSNNNDVLIINGGEFTVFPDINIDPVEKVDSNYVINLHNITTEADYMWNTADADNIIFRILTPDNRFMSESNSFDVNFTSDNNAQITTNYNLANYIDRDYFVEVYKKEGSVERKIGQGHFRVASQGIPNIEVIPEVVLNGEKEIWFNGSNIDLSKLSLTAKVYNVNDLTTPIYTSTDFKRNSDLGDGQSSYSFVIPEDQGINCSLGKYKMEILIGNDSMQLPNNGEFRVANKMGLEISEVDGVKKLIITPNGDFDSSVDTALLKVDIFPDNSYPNVTFDGSDDLTFNEGNLGVLLPQDFNATSFKVHVSLRDSVDQSKSYLLAYSFYTDSSPYVEYYQKVMAVHSTFIWFSVRNLDKLPFSQVTAKIYKINADSEENVLTIDNSKIQFDLAFNYISINLPNSPVLEAGNYRLELLNNNIPVPIADQGVFKVCNTLGIEIKTVDSKNIMVIKPNGNFENTAGQSFRVAIMPQNGNSQIWIDNQAQISFNADGNLEVTLPDGFAEKRFQVDLYRANSGEYIMYGTYIDPNPLIDQNIGFQRQGTEWILVWGYNFDKLNAQNLKVNIYGESAAPRITTSDITILGGGSSQQFYLRVHFENGLNLEPGMYRIEILEGNIPLAMPGGGIFKVYPILTVSPHSISGETPGQTIEIFENGELWTAGESDLQVEVYGPNGINWTATPGNGLTVNESELILSTPNNLNYPLPKSINGYNTAWYNMSIYKMDGSAKTFLSDCSFIVGNDQIKGRVLSPIDSTTSIGGGFVEINKINGGWSTRADVDSRGNYYFDNLPDIGDYRIKAYSPSGSTFSDSAQSKVTVTDLNQTITKDLILSATPQFSGTVTKPEGTPAGNARVSIFKDEGPNEYDDVYTDGEGKFKISGLEPGNYSLEGQKWGIDMFPSDRFDFSIDSSGKYVGTVLTPDLRLCSVQIKGRIFDPTGATAYNTNIRLDSIDGIGGWCNADSGKFGIGRLVSGTFKLIAVPNGDSIYAPSNPVVVSINNGVITVNGAAYKSTDYVDLTLNNPQITGTVLEPGTSQNTVNYGNVDVFDNAGKFLWGSYIQNNGTFALGGLSAGVYKVRVYRYRDIGFDTSEDIKVEILEDGTIKINNEVNTTGQFTIRLINMDIPDGGSIPINITHVPSNIMETSKENGAEFDVTLAVDKLDLNKLSDVNNYFQVRLEGREGTWDSYQAALSVVDSKTIKAHFTGVKAGKYAVRAQLQYFGHNSDNWWSTTIQVNPVSGGPVLLHMWPEYNDAGRDHIQLGIDGINLNAFNAVQGSPIVIKLMSGGKVYATTQPTESDKWPGIDVSNGTYLNVRMRATDPSGVPEGEYELVIENCSVWDAADGNRLGTSVKFTKGIFLDYSHNPGSLGAGTNDFTIQVGVLNLPKDVNGNFISDGLTLQLEEWKWDGSKDVKVHTWSPDPQVALKIEKDFDINKGMITAKFKGDPLPNYDTNLRVVVKYKGNDVINSGKVQIDVVTGPRLDNWQMDTDFADQQSYNFKLYGCNFNKINQLNFKLYYWDPSRMWVVVDNDQSHISYNSRNDNLIDMVYTPSSGVMAKEGWYYFEMLDGNGGQGGIQFYLNKPQTEIIIPENIEETVHTVNGEKKVYSDFTIFMKCHGEERDITNMQVWLYGNNESSAAGVVTKLDNNDIKLDFSQIAAGRYDIVISDKDTGGEYVKTWIGNVFVNSYKGLPVISGSDQWAVSAGGTQFWLSFQGMNLNRLKDHITSIKLLNQDGQPAAEYLPGDAGLNFQLDEEKGNNIGFEVRVLDNKILEAGSYTLQINTDLVIDNGMSWDPYIVRIGEIQSIAEPFVQGWIGPKSLGANKSNYPEGKYQIYIGGNNLQKINPAIWNGKDDIDVTQDITVTLEDVETGKVWTSETVGIRYWDTKGAAFGIGAILATFNNTADPLPDKSGTLKVVVKYKDNYPDESKRGQILPGSDSLYLELTTDPKIIGLELDGNIQPPNYRIKFQAYNLIPGGNYSVVVSKINDNDRSHNTDISPIHSTITVSMSSIIFDFTVAAELEQGNYCIEVLDPNGELLERMFQNIAPKAAAEGTITGKVTLQGKKAGTEGLDYSGVKVSLYKGTEIVKTVTSGKDGSFTMDKIPEGSYTLVFKKDMYLCKKVDNVNVADKQTTDVAALQLLCGDANKDNKIDLVDLGILASSYRAKTGDSNFNVMADFNCDGVVDLVDLGFLASNYRKSGD